MNYKTVVFFTACLMVSYSSSNASGPTDSRRFLSAQSSFKYPNEQNQYMSDKLETTLSRAHTMGICKRKQELLFEKRKYTKIDEFSTNLALILLQKTTNSIEQNVSSELANHVAAIRQLMPDPRQQHIELELLQQALENAFNNVPEEEVN